MWWAAAVAALLALATWVAAAPTNRCNLYQNLGHVFLAKGTVASSPMQLEMAEQWFSSPLLAGCRPADATFGLGQAHTGLGELTSAATALQRGSSREDLRHFVIGRSYEALGRPDDAWQEYSKLPREAAAYFFRLGARADKKGDFEQALHYYSVSTMINPSNAKAYYSAAFVYWRELGEVGKAATMIRWALAVDKKPSMERYLYQGLLCYTQADTNCALAAWLSAAREKARVDPYTNRRYLAYEMLSRLLAEEARNRPEHLAVLDGAPDAP